jgi:hypothetical protein
MKFTPLTSLPDQERAFAMLYTAFSKDTAPANISSKGSLSHEGTGIRWKWHVKAKRNSPDVLLWSNTFQRASEGEVQFTVPLKVIDVNDGALLVVTEDGEEYLGRQTLRKDNKVPSRSQAVFDLGWQGPAYERFEVKGEPGTRTYFACIPLSRGQKEIMDSLEKLADGIRDKPAARSKAEAEKAMWEHYKVNKNLYANARRVRPAIIDLLMNGHVPEDAFRIARAEGDS